MNRIKKNLFFLIGVAIIACVIPYASARAATVRIMPAGSPDTFAITLDTQGASVNTVALHLVFDPRAFSIKTMSDGNSIVDFWITPPSFSDSLGTIDLAGIIPGGILTSSGTIATFSVIPVDSVGGNVPAPSLVSGTVLLNDGKGTPAPFTFIADGSLAVSLPATGTPPTFAIDTMPPDSFIPEITSDPSIFNGKYFLVFSTTDRESGINHYEVLEVPTNAAANVSGGWVVAVSPYLLQDQTLSSNIYVRAVDNAGNFRVVEVPAKHPRNDKPGVQALWQELGILIVILTGIFAVILWTRKHFMY